MNHLGDMDFKVAGTKDGVTSLQMDIKVDSCGDNENCIKASKKRRVTILKEMDKVIKAQSRA